MGWDGRGQAAHGERAQQRHGDRTGRTRGVEAEARRDGTGVAARTRAGAGAGNVDAVVGEGATWQWRARRAGGDRTARRAAGTEVAGGSGDVVADSVRRTASAK
jgi:hypothetical protein